MLHRTSLLPRPLRLCRIGLWQEHVGGRLHLEESADCVPFLSGMRMLSAVRGTGFILRLSGPVYSRGVECDWWGLDAQTTFVPFRHEPVAPRPKWLCFFE